MAPTVETDGHPKAGPAVGLISVPKHLKISNTRASISENGGSWKMLVALAALYSLLVLLTDHAFREVPTPLPATAPPGLFSEGRALQTTSYLADTIGFRQVSTTGEELGAQYLLAQAQSIAQHAFETRPDLHVVAVREQVSGALGLQKAFGIEIANAYNNLTNIVLHISPSNKTAAARPALLVNAHYDSTLGSPGASDAASCVGVALEIARTLVYNSSLTVDAPVVFLFNGGEETLMQASHGFMASSPHASNLGAFINLESTGPWGPDVVFQQTGDTWTLAAYARAAPYPRGTTLAQDFFEMGLIPADTDYRMFSYRHYGSLPGIDVAFVFDGTAYHTARDETSRIRPGTLQGMGDNMLATCLEFVRILAAGDPAHLNMDASVLGGYVYFDILASRMVVYGHKAAAALHSIPLAALLILSLASAAATSSQPFEHTTQGTTFFNTPTPPRVPTPGPLLALGGRALFSVLSTILTPALLGGARALVTGKPMVWYGRPLLAYATFIPAGLVGALLPQIQHDPSLEESRSRSLGYAMVFSLAAALATAVNFHSSYLIASWAAGSIAAAILSPSKVSSSSSWTWGAALAIAASFVFPGVLNVASAWSMADHVMEKIGLSGSLPGPLGIAVPDIVAGAVIGAAVMHGLGAALPYLAGAMGKHTKKVVILLGVASLVAAGWESQMMYTGHSALASVFPSLTSPTEQAHPYTRTHPKRVILQHIHKHTPTGDVFESAFSFSSLDCVPVDASLPSVLRDMPPIEFTTHDWESLYPLNYLVTGIGRPASPPPSDYVAPSLKARKGRSLWARMKSLVVASTEADPAPGSVRWYLDLDTVLPAWAVLNITGGEVSAWSLGPEIASKPLPEGNGSCHMVRYASSGHTTKWTMWVDIPENSPLHIELFVKHLEPTNETTAVVESVPEWVSIAAVTTWQSIWEFA